jgi:hypothetical protein
MVPVNFAIASTVLVLCFGIGVTVVVCVVCVLKHLACTLKARRWAHFALARAKRTCMHLVRTPVTCSTSLPSICGRTGVGLIGPVLGSSFRRRGSADEHVPACPCTGQNRSHCESAPVRPCFVGSDALRLLPPVMFPRVRPAWSGLATGFSTFPSNRAKPPSRLCGGRLANGFHNAVRSSPSGPHCFSAALLVALLLANSLAEWNRDEADPAGVFDHRPGLRLALCRFLRLEDRRRRAGQFRKLLLRFNASVCACWTS